MEDLRLDYLTNGIAFISLIQERNFIFKQLMILIIIQMNKQSDCELLNIIDDIEMHLNNFNAFNCVAITSSLKLSNGIRDVVDSRVNSCFVVLLLKDESKLKQLKCQHDFNYYTWEEKKKFLSLPTEDKNRIYDSIPSSFLNIEKENTISFVKDWFKRIFDSLALLYWYYCYID